MSDEIWQTNNASYILKYKTLILLLLWNIRVGWRNDFLLLILLHGKIGFHFFCLFDLLRQRSIFVKVIGVVSTNNSNGLLLCTKVSKMWLQREVPQYQRRGKQVYVGKIQM